MGGLNRFFVLAWRALRKKQNEREKEKINWKRAAVLWKRNRKIIDVLNKRKKEHTDKNVSFGKWTNEKAIDWVSSKHANKQATKEGRLCLLARASLTHSLIRINLILMREKQTSRLLSLIYSKLLRPPIHPTTHPPYTPLFGLSMIWQMTMRFLVQSTRSMNAEIPSVI